MSSSTIRSGSGLTEKQEAFTRAYLETGNGGESYRRAYDVDPNAKDNWIYVEACQLLDNPKVAQRLKELRVEAEKLSIFNTHAAMDEYEEARVAAMKLEMPAAAISAVNGKVKLFGLDKPYKVETTGKDGNPIQIEEVGKGSAKLSALVERLAGSNAEPSGETGEPS